MYMKWCYVKNNMMKKMKLVSFEFVSLQKFVDCRSVRIRASDFYVYLTVQRAGKGEWLRVREKRLKTAEK